MNRQITLVTRPLGVPEEANFRLVSTPVPPVPEGQVLLKVRYLSVDPYMRGLLREGGTYMAAVPVDGVVVGGTIAEVVESRHEKFQVGDIVESYCGWQEYGLSDGKGLRKIDPALAPISTGLGVLGMPGLTAYFGLLDITSPKAGETVVVSGAAGAVGSIAGQIAKIMGCRVVGIAGSDAKVEHLIKDLGFDAAFNYKTVKNYRAKVAELCPNGVDVYFDNVGGPVSDGVWLNINTGARISVCGQIANYNDTKPEPGPRLMFQLIVKQARAEGFLVFQFAKRYAEGIQKLAGWLAEGKLTYRETVVEGLENAPRAFIGLFLGENTGKQIVKVS